MNHARNGRASATFDIGHCAGNGACGWHAAKEGRYKVGHALRHQLLVGVVAVVNQAVGDASAKQRLDGAQQGQGDDGHAQVLQVGQAEFWPNQPGQFRGYTAKFAADGFNWQVRRLG